MYYTFDCDPIANTHVQKKQWQNSHVSLMRGKPLDVVADEVELPFLYTLEVAAGEKARVFDWYPSAYLISKRLARALQAAGVNNLQLFDSRLKHQRTKKNVPGYVTINVIGRIACAVPEANASMPLATKKYFTKLVIDPTRANGQLMFRLKESPLLILLHESVVKRIDTKDYVGLVLKPVREA
jgi:hypothetical protein